jgi:uncharacterized protein YndB with AHSA1/START domain
VFTARIDRTYDLDVHMMWSLWTDPDHLSRWSRPSLEEFGPTVATLELRPGGDLRIEMVLRDGGVHAVTGRIVTTDEPSRLSFTWRWEGTEHESLVDVTFSERDGKTTVAIVHTRLATQDDADRHSQGWAGCLDSLARTT